MLFLGFVAYFFLRIWCLFLFHKKFYSNFSPYNVFCISFLLLQLLPETDEITHQFHFLKEKKKEN